MWYYNAEIIKTPKPMVINGLKYEPGLFRDAEKLKELGFKNYTELVLDCNMATSD